jgi:hypothetical protein
MDFFPLLLSSPPPSSPPPLPGSLPPSHCFSSCSFVEELLELEEHEEEE